MLAVVKVTVEWFASVKTRDLCINIPLGYKNRGREFLRSFHS